MLRYRTSPILFRHKSRHRTSPSSTGGYTCSVTNTALTEQNPGRSSRQPKSHLPSNTHELWRSHAIPNPHKIHNPSEYIILVRLRRGGGWEERLKALLPTEPNGLMSRIWHSDNFPIFWLVSERGDVWTKWPVRTQDAKSLTESDCICT
jgi:hypothetical protein